MSLKEETILPNVVPNSFSPRPEQFEIPVTQELRSRQSHIAQGFALQVIGGLERQLRLAWYRREPTWQQYSEMVSDTKLQKAIKTAKTVRTVMMDRISEWAGNYSEAEFEAIMPQVWDRFVKIVQNPEDAKPAAKEEIEAPPQEEPSDENDLALEDMEPIQVIERPEIPEDAPQSQVQAPKEESWQEVLGKKEEEGSS